MSCERGRYRKRAGILVTLLALAPLNAGAQAPPASQVTPETLRPPEDFGGGGIVMSGAAPLDVPAGAERLTVTIANVRIEGGFPELAAVTAELSRQIVGRRTTAAELYAFAGVVEQAYAAAGYVLARVVLPPQTLLDGGELRLLVVDGYVEDVDVQALSPRVRDVVVSRMAPLIGQRRIKLDEIERRLLLASHVPGLRLRSTLARGREQGGTRLILNGEHNTVGGTLGVNNHMNESYGRWQYASSAEVNSAFGFGEQVYGTYIGSDELGATLDGTAPLRIAGVGAVIPIGTDGLTLNPEYTHSRSRPIDQLFATQDVFERFALRVSYPVVLTRARRLDVEALYEHNEAISEAIDFGLDLDHDRYSVVRLGLDHTSYTSRGAPVFLSATVSQGLGGRDESDAIASGVPLSRMGSDPDFQKLVAEMHYIHPLPEDLRVSLLVRGQTSFGTPLFASEQFSLDGPQSISGFESGTFSVDEGLLARSEISRSFSLPTVAWATVVTPYVFGAAGRGWLVEPTIVEPGRIDVASVGVGTRAFVEGPDGLPLGSMSLQLARRLTAEPRAEEGDRVLFNAGVKF